MSMPSPHAPLYPIFLSLEGRACLVAGLGGPGATQARGVCWLAARLRCWFWISCERKICLRSRSLLTDPRACFESRTCTPTDIQGRALVFAASRQRGGKRPYRRLVPGGECALQLCQRARAGRFQRARRGPARRACGGLVHRRGQSGSGPALAMRTGGLAGPARRVVLLMGRLRPLVLALHAETGQNTELFRRVAASPLQHWLAEGDLQSCRQWLLAELPPVLHVHIAELLDDLP